MKRVLMLAYFFPPSKAAGTFRTLRFVRDLPACGWEPSVLTTDAATHPPIEVDAGLLAKVPAGTVVHRTAAPAYHRWYKRSMEATRWMRPRRRRAAPAAGAAPASESLQRVRSPLDVLYMLCRTPDIDAGWYAPALARGLRVVRREQPRVLYATGGPWTTFLVARDLSALTGVPLVIDYRDPWTSNPATPRTGSVFENLAHTLEASVIHRARALVANTDVLRDTLLESHGASLGDKITVIHNSFDASDYASSDPDPEPVFTFTYVGAMYDAHSPEPLLAGLLRLFDDAPHWRGRFRIRLVGNGAPRVADRVRALGLEDVVRCENPIAHADAVRLQRAAQALVLLLTVPSERSTFVPSKLFEYLAAGRPILAITRGGALDALLHDHGLTPWIFRPDDAAGIAAGLVDVMERARAGTLPRLAPDTVRGFSGEAAAAHLARVLECAASGTPLPADECAAPLPGAESNVEVVAS